MSDPLLDLSTSEPLPQVRIDGESYSLRLDLEYVDLLRLRETGERIQHLSDLKPRTEQHEAELRELLHRMTAQAIDAPDAVLAKLNDIQRFQLSQVFGKQIAARMDPTRAGDGRLSPVSGDTTGVR